MSKEEQDFLVVHIFTQKITLGLPVLTLPYQLTKSLLEFKPVFFWTDATGDSNLALCEL